MDTPRLRPTANARTRAAPAVCRHRLMRAQQVHPPPAERRQEVDRRLDQDVIVDRAQFVDGLVERTPGKVSFRPGDDRMGARRRSATLKQAVLTGARQRNLRCRGVAGQVEQFGWRPVRHHRDEQGRFARVPGDAAGQRVAKERRPAAIMEERHATRVRVEPATVGASQAPRENDAEVAVDDRQTVGDVLKLLPAQDEHLDVGSGAHSCRSWLARKQGHLAQGAADTDPAEQVFRAVAVGDEHLRQPVLNDVHLFNGLAFAENDRPRRESPPLQTPHDLGQFGCGKPLEEGRRGGVGVHAGPWEYKEGDMAANQPPADLAEALAVIARQEVELARLRQQQGDARLAEELRAVLVRSALAGTLATRVTHSRLLEMIVETAAQVISSAAASLFLVDEERRELVFEIALGQKSEEVKKFRVPLGHGIAGHVAATGQPTATSGTGDPRQAREIGEIVGYVPQTILCVPLFYADRVIGVLELLDKSDGASFTMLDMQVLGRFANIDRKS